MEMTGEGFSQKNTDPIFRRYSRYLKEKYGERVYRISVDAGFTCPHRLSDGSGGCTFCDERGSRAVYQEEAFEGKKIRIKRGGGAVSERLELIRLQIERGRAFLSKRYGTDKFILYFQAFTNTFGPPEVLDKIYRYALSLESFRELIVSTRPDCVGPAHADLLASYKSENFDVWVELGLQSYHDATLERVNRGHLSSVFTRAYNLLKERGIKVTVHLIFGLPGEGRREIMQTVDKVALLRPDGIKIHNLDIVRGTELEAEYMRGELNVPSDKRHLEYVMEALERLPEETVVQRVTCDTRKETLAAPLRFMDKNRFYSSLDKEMRRRGKRQGRLFQKEKGLRG
ncbi:MAG: TIGR01212 family radical SAM protein [Spirochaetaceae bacterium]